MSEDEQEYKTHSIGQHIVTCKLIFTRREKVSQVLKTIRNDRKDWPNSENVFVLNMDGKLIGIVDFKKLVASSDQTRLEQIMTRRFEVVTAHSHQHRVARLAITKGMDTIPVVDQEGKFLGIINPRAILTILHEEHVEDLMRFSGIVANEDELDINKLSTKSVIIKRLPWLVLGIVGGMIATKVVGNFENALQTQLALAFFIPVIVYMNDAVGTQTETIYVRTAAFEKVDIKKYLTREIKTSFVLAIILSSLISLFAYSIFANKQITLIVGTSMFIGVITASLLATIIPWLFTKFKKDPAAGSGPFTTVIQDILSLVIYFTIASVLLF